MTYIIRTMKDIRRGVAVLCERDTHLAALYGQVGLPPVRLFDGGFEGLARIMVAQRISRAAARAIEARLVAAVQPLTPAALLATPPGVLREVGLSAAVQRHMTALARTLHGGAFDTAALAAADDETAARQLMTLSGIGRWSADIYLLSCLGRADAWPGHDLALQRTAGAVFFGRTAPDAVAMERLARPWRPWRGVAARLLWHYYARCDIGNQLAGKENKP